MRQNILFFSSVVLISLLSAGECTQMQNDYKAAEQAYKTSVKENQDARSRYPLVNKAMDKAVALLAYCHDDISLSEQHLLRSQLRKLDIQRSNLASAAIDEYRQQYGIKPQIQTIFQDGRRSSRTSPRSSFPPPNQQPFPPVTQPAMPPLLR